MIFPEGVEVRVVVMAQEGWWDLIDVRLCCAPDVYDLVTEYTNRDNAPIVGIIGRCEAYEEKQSGLMLRCFRSGQFMPTDIDEIEYCLCDKHAEEDELIFEEET